MQSMSVVFLVQPLALPCDIVNVSYQKYTTVFNFFFVLIEQENHLFSPALYLAGLPRHVHSEN